MLSLLLSFASNLVCSVTNTTSFLCISLILAPNLAKVSVLCEFADVSNSHTDCLLYVFSTSTEVSGTKTGVHDLSVCIK